MSGLDFKVYTCEMHSSKKIIFEILFILAKERDIWFFWLSALCANMSVCLSGPCFLSVPVPFCILLPYCFSEHFLTFFFNFYSYGLPPNQKHPTRACHEKSLTYTNTHSLTYSHKSMRTTEEDVCCLCHTTQHTENSDGNV